MATAIETAQMMYTAQAQAARSNAKILAPRAETPIGTWSGTVEKKHLMVETGKFTEEGNVVRRHVSLRTIVLTKDGCEDLRFSVTHITNKKTGYRSTTVSDKRGMDTGNGGTTGLWGTRNPMPIANRAKSLTPPAWYSEVTPRYITLARAKELLIEAGWDQSTRSL